MTWGTGAVWVPREVFGSCSGAVDGACSLKKKHKCEVTGTGQESERPGELGRSYRACSDYYRGGGKGSAEPEGEERL